MFYGEGGDGDEGEDGDKKDDEEEKTETVESLEVGRSEERRVGESYGRVKWRDCVQGESLSDWDLV